MWPIAENFALISHVYLFFYRMYLFKMFTRFLLTIFLGFSLVRKAQHLFQSPLSSLLGTDQWKGIESLRLFKSFPLETTLDIN